MTYVSTEADYLRDRMKKARPGRRTTKCPRCGGWHITGESCPVRTHGKMKKLPKMTFETALRHLRAGKVVRRRAWHPETRIFRLGNDVWLKLPSNVLDGRQPPSFGAEYGSSPTYWKPYPGDFLANDWEIAK